MSKTLTVDELKGRPLADIMEHCRKHKSATALVVYEALVGTLPGCSPGEIAAERGRLVAAEAETARAQAVAEFERAFDAKMAERGLPKFVRPDGPDAAAHVVMWASLPGKARAERLAQLLDARWVALAVLNGRGFQRTGSPRRLESHGAQIETIPVSVWRWLQATSERCLATGEGVHAPSARSDGATESAGAAEPNPTEGRRPCVTNAYSPRARGGPPRD